MANIQFLIKFYTHPITITILTIVISSILISLICNKLTKKVLLKKRALIFGVISSTFLWLFLILSILLCAFFEYAYLEYPLKIIKIVGGLSTIGALLVSLAISSIVYKRASQSFIENIPLSEFTKKEEEKINKILIKYKLLRDIKFKKIDIEAPNAFSITGSEKIIFITKGLLKNLNSKELASVILHEVSHISNEDSKIKLYTSIMAKIIFFDLILGFVKNKISGEMEIIADEYSIKQLQSKSSLLSALNKINKYYLNNNQISVLPSIYAVQNEQAYLNERIKHINFLV